MARGLLRRKARDDRSLDPTGLVNEAATRLLADAKLRGHANPGYVFRAAVQAMRRILVERARQRKQLKRGGRLVIPVGDANQELTLITRTDEGFVERKVLPVMFVPMTGKAQAPAAKTR